MFKSILGALAALTIAAPALAAPPPSQLQHPPIVAPGFHGGGHGPVVRGWDHDRGGHDRDGGGDRRHDGDRDRGDRDHFRHGGHVGVFFGLGLGGYPYGYPYDYPSYGGYYASQGVGLTLGSPWVVGEGARLYCTPGARCDSANGELTLVTGDGRLQAGEILQVRLYGASASDCVASQAVGGGLAVGTDTDATDATTLGVSDDQPLYPRTTYRISYRC